jgi:hypothetical protein
MREVADVNELAQAIRAKVEGRARPVIGIDGADGSGKTFLATEIGTVLNLSVVSVDDFVEKERGNYVEHIQQAELEAALGSAETGVIVEGVCLLDVVDRLALSADCLVYVKRCDADGFWYEDGDYGDPSGSADVVIARLSQQLAAVADLSCRFHNEPGDPFAGSVTPLREEIIRYHYRARPHERADFVYLRRETG